MRRVFQARKALAVWSGVKTRKDTVKRFKRWKEKKIRQKISLILLFYGWSQEECGRKYTFSLLYCSRSSQTVFHPWERLTTSRRKPLPVTSSMGKFIQIFRMLLYLHIVHSTTSLPVCFVFTPPTSSCIVYVFTPLFFCEIFPPIFLPFRVPRTKNIAENSICDTFFLIMNSLPHTYTHTGSE